MFRRRRQVRRVEIPLDAQKLPDGLLRRLVKAMGLDRIPQVIQRLLRRCIVLL